MTMSIKGADLERDMILTCVHRYAAYLRAIAALKIEC
jgi:hypothetical protein